jgi:hypothetical protein
VPPSLRGRVYRKIFNISVKHREEEYFKSLEEHSKNWELLTDDLVEADPYDKDFFIFEETVDKLLELFF